MENEATPDSDLGNEEQNSMPNVERIESHRRLSAEQAAQEIHRAVNKALSETMPDEVRAVIESVQIGDGAIEKIASIIQRAVLTAQIGASVSAQHRDAGEDGSLPSSSESSTTADAITLEQTGWQFDAPRSSSESSGEGQSAPVELSECKWCNDGLKPEFIDRDGVKVSISLESGVLSHAWEDSWWPCLRRGMVRCMTWQTAQPSESDASSAVASQVEVGSIVPHLHCSCGATCTEEEYKDHQQRGCDAGATKTDGEVEADSEVETCFVNWNGEYGEETFEAVRKSDYDTLSDKHRLFRLDSNRLNASLIDQRDSLRTENEQLLARCEAAESLTARWKTAIEGLTPQGSEYVNDPDACAAAIRQRCQYPKMIIELKRQVAELSAEVARVWGQAIDIAYNLAIENNELARIEIVVALQTARDAAQKADQGKDAQDS